MVVSRLCGAKLVDVKPYSEERIMEGQTSHGLMLVVILLFVGPCVCSASSPMTRQRVKHHDPTLFGGCKRAKGSICVSRIEPKRSFSLQQKQSGISHALQGAYVSGASFLLKYTNH